MEADNAERDLEQAMGLADEREVQLRDRAVTVRALRLVQLGPFSRAIRPIWNAAGAVAGQAAAEGEGGGEDNVTSLLQTALMDNTEDVINAIEAATPLEREEVEQLDLEETLRLAEAVISVNADFFTRRVLPAMKSLIQSQRDQILAARAASGSTSSSDSSEQGTT